MASGTVLIIRSIINELPPQQVELLKKHKDVFTHDDWELVVRDPKYIQVLVALASMS
jgi:hypothetical protein